MLTAIDHGSPQSGNFYLKYEFGANYDPSLPTVFAIADGQQFWARPGRATRFQNEIFGDSLNVVVIFSRALDETISSGIYLPDGTTDWPTAYRVYKADQWIEDIETVRKKISPNDKILLYGRSGGGLLLLQYLEKYHQHVERAFCQTAILPDLEIILGFRHDKFWEEILDFDETLTIKLKQVIEEGDFQKDDIMLAFQRQNFFVSAEDIDTQRAFLINTLHSKQKNVFDSLLNTYQVEAVKRMMPTPPGISSIVRQYEFYLLEGFDEIFESNDSVVRPNIEALRFYARPLLSALKQNQISRPESNFKTFHRMDTQVFLFAGRWDHTVDYRGQYYIRGLIPNSYLFLANDNHVFSTIYDTDNYGNIVRHALQFDLDDSQMKSMLRETENLRWNEWMPR